MAEHADKNTRFSDVGDFRNDESQNGHQGAAGFYKNSSDSGKILTCHEKDVIATLWGFLVGWFCLFYFIGVLYCVIFWGFSFLLNSSVTVDMSVLHFSRGVFCISFQ